MIPDMDFPLNIRMYSVFTLNKLNFRLMSRLHTGDFMYFTRQNKKTQTPIYQYAQ